MKALAIVLLALCSGCCNLIGRCGEGTGYWSTRGYHGISHPYRATKETWDILCLPDQDPILSSYVMLTYPFWVVDEVLEAAVDTVFLPVDLTVTAFKE